MKKLIEIPFNHELIGQPGIEVKYRNGEKVLDIQYLKNTATKSFVFSVDVQGNIWNHLKTGEYSGFKHPLDLIMYKEVEVKEPKQIFIIETLSGDIVCTVRTIKEAQNIIHNLALTKNHKYKITKFIEVTE